MFPVTAFYPKRFYFHGSHYKKTRVFGTEEVTFDPESSDLQISFSHYREILEKHLTCCKGLQLQLGAELQLIDMRDAQSQLIHDILLRRADDGFDMSHKVDIDVLHVAVVQELMAHDWVHPEFVHLLRRTADDFRYTTMLNPSHVHMELLHYNVDSPPPNQPKG
ncbi:hypothetical protein BD410DRAFT_603646 [Rickenella mellea]|uniref:Uncharacterized protein n=1 Tax=Rickenella mellea TaxID=50990 RepID=A0A4Y7QDA4_9AGAM|nr:hypothetical protein BD410DRAFT_603646 [Rickenella mellea]